MVSPKDEMRYSGERMPPDRYYDDRVSHCYREIRDERDLNLSSNSLNSSSGNMGRRSQEPPDPERGKSIKKIGIFKDIFVLSLDVKRRKVDGSSSKVSIGVR